VPRWQSPSWPAWSRTSSARNSALRQITGFSNELVKRVRSLRDKKHRKREGLFLAEGLRILTEARDAGALPEILFFAPEGYGHPLAKGLVAATDAAGGEVIETTPEILSKLSGKDNPQTLVGVYRDRLTPLDRIDRSASGIWIVAQALRDPGNLGTMLRTGDAVGAGGLILVDDCVDPFSVEAVRASMGALFTQKIAAARWPEFVTWLRAGPGQLVGTSLRTETDYQGTRYRAPTFILVGNEAQGLPAAYEDECDLLVKMPMLGKADSLNAAIATAVMAYEVLNQRRTR
jgi:RNA methyltransferase, TrmH family